VDATQDVRLAQDGDTDAWERLIQAHMPRIFRLLRSQLSSPEDIDDVAQDVCLHAIIGIRGLRKPELFGQWFRTVAFNRAMQWQRRRYAEDAIRPRLWQPDSQGIEDDQAVSRIDIVAALGLLPPSDRDAIVLHYVYDWSSTAIAKLQGKPAGTVRWRIHQAREVLRTALVSDPKSKE